MKAVTQVLAPMLSVNEPDAQVVEVFVTTGRKVELGDPLCTLETTKATFEVQSEVGGYIHNVMVAKGQQVTAGTILFEISSEPCTEAPASVQVSSASAPEAGSLPEGLLISEKGLRLAKELGVAMSLLPVGTLVTEAIVREVSARAPRSGETEPLKVISQVKVPFDANQLIIIGAGGHAKTIIDIIRQSNQYHLAGLVAEPPPPGVSEVLRVPVLGGDEVLQSLYDKGIRLMAIGVGAINRNRIRYDIFVKMAERGFGFPHIVHPKAVVEPSVELGDGVQVFGMAFIGSDARVGLGAVINTGVLVSHDCRIGDFAHLTPGVVLAGGVEVGSGALIGMGVTIAVGIKIGEWARIGNGARIIGDVPPHTIVQAGSTWP